MHCGLDFGTSNSTAGGYLNNQIQMVHLENNKTLLPSTIFFDYETKRTLFGQQAIQRYLDGTEGRFLRSLKSILGSNLLSEKTQIYDERKSIEDILVMFLKHIKQKTESEFNQEIESLTIGRPVFFVDDNPEKDKIAEQQLLTIAHLAGFKNISLYFEPLAASLHHAQTIETDELCLVVDIGGGTADFSISHLYKNAPSSKHTILSSGGIHLGGTNIDHDLSLAKIMPSLGFQKDITPVLKTPNSLYDDLSSWHKIQTLYTIKQKNNLKEMLCLNPNFSEYKRLLSVLEKEKGHDLLFRIEQAKINLSLKKETSIDLNDIEKNLSVSVSSQNFEDLLKYFVDSLKKTIKDILIQAQISSEKIQTIFLTGGTTKIPFIKKSLCLDFPNARIIDTNIFHSVGMGLTLKAMENK